MPSTESTFYPRVFASVTAVVLGYALLRILQPFAVPLLWAGLLAFLLYPVNTGLCRLLRGRRTLAALLLTFGAVLVIIAPVAFVVSAFVAQTTELVASLQAGAARYQIQQPSDVLHIPVVDRLVQWTGQRLPVSPQQLQEWAVKTGQEVLQGLIGMTGSLFASVFAAVAAVVLALFLFFFFVRDGAQIVTRGMSLVPLDDRRKTHLLNHLSDVTRAIVLGSLVTAVVQGILVGVGFLIAGLPSPIVFGVLASVAAMIPLIGTAIVWAPAALWYAATGHWGVGLFLAVWGVAVVSSADNVVRPLFISSRAKITTLPVFIGLFGGVSAFGPIGIFLGPVLVALALALVEFAEDARAEEGRT